MTTWAVMTAAVLTGLIIAVGAWLLLSWLLQAPERIRLRRRLVRPAHQAASTATSTAPSSGSSQRRAWAPLLRLLDRLRVLERLSRNTGADAVALPNQDETAPRSAANAPSLELRLARAGFAQVQAGQRLLVLKSVLFLSLPLLCAAAVKLMSPQVDLQTWLLVLTLGAATAHYGPDAIIAWLAARRREQLQAQLPGFTDLLQVCVQAGMGLDAAVQRVVAEHRHGAPDLAGAFHQASLEMRAGVARQQALLRLAQLADAPDLRTLVNMLVQAEQFGTSLGDALRQQAQEIRARRMARAEERAARIPVLMLIPLVLCIFPALMAVLMGPAVIQMMQAWV